MYQEGHENIGKHRYHHGRRGLDREDRMAAGSGRPYARRYADDSSSRDGSPEWNDRRSQHGVYKLPRSTHAYGACDDGEWAVPNTLVDSSYADNGPLADLRALAGREAEQLGCGATAARASVFNPPNSPVRNSFDYLREYACAEAFLLNEARRSSERNKYSKISYIIQTETNGQQPAGSRAYGSVYASPIRIESESTQDGSASHSFEQSVPVRSFNDFDEGIFKFNAETEKYMCPAEGCAKEFPSLSRIKRHFIIHTNIKPFKCRNKDCDRTFSRKDNMLQHYRVHCPHSSNNS
ncbi:hypothetical protein PAPHI01_0915 [Pancytospora philotis]|nr:hypothetical protein PAPHI01_0915 [Pancytospora philotis]